jgi:polar amino acid transport system substrate-binding protein
MKKRIGMCMASLAMVGALALTGCGGSDAPSPNAGSGSDDGYTLVKEGTLSVGTSAEYPPFEYIEDGEYRGFDLELAEAIADDLGLELEIGNMDFDGLCAAVASGTKYDVAFGAITITPKREKQVDFTDPYYMDDQALITSSAIVLYLYPSPKGLNTKTSLRRKPQARPQTAHSDPYARRVLPSPLGHVREGRRYSTP